MGWSQLGTLGSLTRPMPDPPRSDELLSLLLQLCRDELGVNVAPESDFIAAGGSSVQALMISHGIAEHFDDQVDGIEMLGPQALFDHPTLRDAAAQLAESLEARAAD